MPTIIPETSETLLKELSMDPTSKRWAEFEAAYRPVMEMYYRCMTNRRSHCAIPADDVIQETLIALVKKLPSFKYDSEKGRFRAYLRKMVNNKFIELYRQGRGNRMEFNSEKIDTKAIYSASKEDDEEARIDLIHNICMIIFSRITDGGVFSGNTLAVFRAVVINGESIPEVAAAYGMKPNAVSQIKSRVMARITKEIRKEMTGCEDLSEMMEKMLNKAVGAQTADGTGKNVTR